MFVRCHVMFVKHRLMSLNVCETCNVCETICNVCDVRVSTERQHGSALGVPAQSLGDCLDVVTCWL